MGSYLHIKIVEQKRTRKPKYSSGSGIPTNMMIKLYGETKWRRVMFTNEDKLTYFISYKGRRTLIRNSQLQCDE